MFQAKTRVMMSSGIRERIGCALLAIITWVGGACAQAGSIDPTFNSMDVGYGYGDRANASVRDIRIQADGKILIAGLFDKFDGLFRGRVARLGTDGLLDPTFDPGSGANNIVYRLLLQPDGKIIIAGNFTQFGGVARTRIARLNSNGTLDGSFDPGGGANEAVRSIALQPDGKVLIGGGFTTVAGAARNGIARLNSDGSLDTGFDPGTGANGTVYSICVTSAGKIVIGGNFTSYNGVSRQRYAQLNANGTLDLNFVYGSGVNGTVYALEIQADGKILMAGNFTQFNVWLINRMIRLGSDGVSDPSFVTGPGVDGLIEDIAVQPDGMIVAGGSFSNWWTQSRNGVCRFTSTGALDYSFVPGTGAIGGPVMAVAVRSDGKVVVGGAFVHFAGHGHNRLTQLSSTGDMDLDFNVAGTGANMRIHSTAIQPDGKVLIIGDFTAFNGTARNYLARLNSNGTMDTSFDPGDGLSSGPAQVLALPDGKILIAGGFDEDGIYSSPPTRLNADGSRDATFGSGGGADGAINAMALQPDGKILICGTFTSYAGVSRGRIARLHPDGTLDLSFDPGSGATGTPRALAVGSDGKVVIGNITQFNGIPRNGIARLNTNGSLDTSFDPGAGTNNSVYSVTVDNAGRVLLGGIFTTFNSLPAPRLVRLNTDGTVDGSFNVGTGPNNWVKSILLCPDNRILVAGYFTSYNGSTRRRIARLNSDGSVDPSFLTSPGAESDVETVAMQPDGNLVIAGDFINYNNTGRNRVARIIGTSNANIKVMLEGPYSGGTMNDALRTLPSFPLTEPFTAMGYAETGYVSGASIGSNVLTATGNNAIVDWVLAEMRPVATPGIVAASRAVLLQRDGDVVDLDGVSTVGFAGLASGSYCVAVKPRNHLPVMLSPTTPLSYGSAVAAVDLTLSTTQVYDNDARKNVGGVMVLAAGDVTFNENAQYTGLSNDRDPILTRVGATTPTNAVGGYWREDVNMDGVVKYTGSNNDRDPILVNVGSATPNNTRVATLP